MLRIRRKRTRGWRKPSGAVYVGRPSVWANPFDWRTLGREEAARRYRAWLRGEAYREVEPERRAEILRRLPELRGRALMCWCPLHEPCHADILLELVENGPERCSE